jgi:hypothetical protein
LADQTHEHTPEFLRFLNELQDEMKRAGLRLGRFKLKPLIESGNQKSSISNLQDEIESAGHRPAFQPDTFGGSLAQSISILFAHLSLCRRNHRALAQGLIKK